MLNFDSAVRSQSSTSSGSFAPEKPMDELPESQSRMCSCPAAYGVAADPSHGVPHSA
jgi:hypothetical protein